MKYILALSLIAIAMPTIGMAQEEPLPENPGMAGPSQEDIQAQQGMDIEEGLEPEEAPEVSESQQSFENDKAEKEEEIKQEEADAAKEEADAEYNESLEPTEVISSNPTGVIEPVVEPVVRE